MWQLSPALGGNRQGSGGSRRPRELSRLRRGQEKIEAQAAGENTHNFPPQPQLFRPPRISSETTAAEQPSAWGATLPLVVGSKGVVPPPLSLFFFFRLVLGAFPSAVPCVSCARSRVGDAATGMCTRATAGGWDAAFRARGGCGHSCPRQGRGRLEGEEGSQESRAGAE